MNSNKTRTLATYRHPINAPMEKVFPLLCPNREYEWIDTWSCKILFSASGYSEENCVFTTSFFEDIGPETWMICTYEPPRRIEFVRISEKAAIRFNLTLEPNGEDACTWGVEIITTGLTPEGEKLAAQLNNSSLAVMFKPFCLMLDQYAKTGKMLPHAEAMRIAAE